MSEATQTSARMMDGRDGEPHPLGDADLVHAQIQALEQLLEVHEQTSLEQATRLEHALRAGEDLLAREKAARAAQSDSEARLRLALDAGRMGTWDWDIARERVNWSPEQERLYGMAEGEFSGTIEEYRERIHPEDRESSLQKVQEALRSHAPTHHVRHRIVRMDGEVRWLDSHARFIYSDGGQPLRLVGVSTDVTDQHRVEVALREREAEAKAERARLYEVFMQAPAAIAVVEGPQHVFTVSNPLYQELVGERALLGKTVREAFPELVGQGLYELLDRVYETGEPFVADEMLVKLDRDRDGIAEDVYIDFVYQPLKNPGGASVGILAHAVDVTDQVRARQLVEQKAEQLARLTLELERSNAELDQFAYVASHDLKAPLRGIANLTQWMEDDLGELVTGESKEHMQLLKGRVHRMEALIEGILDYSRAGRVRNKPEQVDVHKLLTESIELLSPPEGVDIVVGPGMPTIETERVPLQQVLMNLIGNAIKYNRQPGARVEIGVERQAHHFQFSIADNGPGIAPQYRDRIWQIFQTLAARDKVEGTGIGLSVVRKIVEGRGGRAWLESEVGRGSTFFFTWPINPEMTP